MPSPRSGKSYTYSCSGSSGGRHSLRVPVLLHQLFLQIDRDDWLSGPLKLLPPGTAVLELRVRVGGLPTPQHRALRLQGVVQLVQQPVTPRPLTACPSARNAFASRSALRQLQCSGPCQVGAGAGRQPALVAGLSAPCLARSPSLLLPLRCRLDGSPEPRLRPTSADSSRTAQAALSRV